jgi:hypothetical protein
MNEEKALALRLADELDRTRIGRDAVIAAELRRLHAVSERLRVAELANNLWHEKTDWVQETVRPLELGRHRADVLKQRIERLHALNGELLEALENLEKEFRKVYPIYYYAEPWGHETNVPLQAARSTIKKVKEV